MTMAKIMDIIKKVMLVVPVALSAIKKILGIFKTEGCKCGKDGCVCEKDKCDCE